ncbi:MAG: exodeoxyribonuclease VII large subunit [Bacteroidetes bacterium]|nr:exodeoxyribonuclease VII large subunit [Bacteroidota bacterium]
MIDTTTSAIQKSFSLLEVMNSVQSVVKKNYDSKKFWVKCELVKLNLHQSSGHCYLELADRNESTMVAQCKGIIWADSYQVIQQKFRSTINSELASGMKVLFQCNVTFHPIHGFSLYVTDVEPAFTLGEMAKMKNDSILKLKSEKVFDLNKQKKLPLLPKRIAVISVETSRGYQDFIITINNYHKKFALELSLFEATLQGDNAITTIVRALQKIASRIDDFDVVTIIRGGAGDTGLACYDEYALAKEVACFPIPIVTGIGHATNETVTEMVAFKNCITPTAAADFFLEKFYAQDILINQLSEKLINSVSQSLNDTKEYFFDTVNDFQALCISVMEKSHALVNNTTELLVKFSRRALVDEKLYLQNNINVLKNIPGRQLISQQRNLEEDLLKRNYMRNVSHQFKNQNQTLSLLESKINLLDPINTLARGYSITRKNGKAITSVTEINIGDSVETTVAEGKFTGTINEILK